MKPRRGGKTNFLVGLLLISVSLLVAAIGLRLDLTNGVLDAVSLIAAITDATVSVALVGGLIYGVVKSKAKITPSKIRVKLTEEFERAEKNFLAFERKLRAKNFFYGLYNALITTLGVVGYLCCSFLLFTNFNFSYLIAILYMVAPLYRWIGLSLRKGENDDGKALLKEEEFPETVNFIKEEVEKTLGKGNEISAFFDSENIVSIKKHGKSVYVGLNTYCFLLLSKEEISSAIKRETLAILSKEYRKTQKLLDSRDFYSSEMPLGFINGFLFSFIIEDTVTYFDFAKNAISRRLEKIKDGLILNTDQNKSYITAHKKHCVFETYLSDPTSFIYLNMYRRGEDMRDFTGIVFSYFLEFYEKHGESWENQVERKLTPKVSDKLSFSEKKAVLGDTYPIEFKNNATEEMKCIYDKFGLEYYETAKHFYDMRKQGFESSDREIMRYEQNPDEYTERLKLIDVAHAYYSLGDLQKTEEVYAKILEKFNSPESNFDYGAFLLTVQKDKRGVDYIYSAMENENLVDDGFELLGKYFILSGDSDGYEKFCEYKQGKLDEVVKGLSKRVLDQTKPFKEISLDEEVLNEIIQTLTKDDNVSEIYCADGKTQDGSKVYVFGIAVRNKSEQSFFETYDRVFSILDNEYGKYDTFLLAIDAEKKRKAVKKITKGEKFLKFKK